MTVFEDLRADFEMLRQDESNSFGFKPGSGGTMAYLPGILWNITYFVRRWARSPTMRRIGVRSTLRSARSCFSRLGDSREASRGSNLPKEIQLADTPYCDSRVPGPCATLGAHIIPKYTESISSQLGVSKSGLRSTRSVINMKIENFGI